VHSFLNFFIFYLDLLFTINYNPEKESGGRVFCGAYFSVKDGLKKKFNQKNKTQVIHKQYPLSPFVDIL